MEGSRIEFFEGPRQIQEIVGNVDLELLWDEIEYLQLKADFFEGQTVAWILLINKQELKNKESLKKEQELVDKINEKEIEKKKLITYLKALKNQPQIKNNSTLGYDAATSQKNLTKINGCFSCPECRIKINRKENLNRHLNAVHRKLKPWKCSDCDKG